MLNNLKKIFPFLYNIFLHDRLRRRYPSLLFKTLKIGLNCKIGYKVALMEDVEIRDNVKIGNYSYCSKGTIIISGQIGSFCSIGYRCQIGMFEHPIDQISTSPWIFKENKSILGLNLFTEIHSPPIIGNDVWIGSNSVILQGVVIGDGVIVAAGSIVTKDVPPYAIVAGIPAKIIKYRFEIDQIEFLKKFKWFELSEKELQDYIYLFEKKERWFENISNTMNS